MSLINTASALTIFAYAEGAFKIAGSLGGVIYLFSLYDRYRNRVRVVVRVLSHHERIDSTSILRFEAENIGSTPTSINHRVKFSGFLPRPIAKTTFRLKMSPFAFELLIDGANRTLQSHVPIELEARSQNTNTYTLDRLGFMFFKTYTFSFTHGRTRKVRIYSADDDRINLVQYWIGRFLVTVLGIRGLRRPKDRSEEVANALSR